MPEQNPADQITLQPQNPPNTSVEPQNHIDQATTSPTPYSPTVFPAVVSPVSAQNQPQSLGIAPSSMPEVPTFGDAPIQASSKGRKKLLLVAAIFVALIGLGSAVWAVLNQHQATKQQVKPNLTLSTKTSIDQNKLPIKQAPATISQPAPSPASTSTPTPSPTPVVQPSPPVSGTVNTVTETYKISSDGTSAQEAPVTWVLSNTTSVDLIIQLTCLGACQFKLVSDSYTGLDATTYTSSQHITYHITKPGQWVFYNQYTPSTKFSIKF